MIILQEQLYIQMINSNIAQITNLTLLQRKNKAIKDCKEKYEKIVALDQNMKDKNANIREQIEKQCELINQTLIKLQQRSKDFIKNCIDALREQKRNPQIICVSELTSYLKMQKQVLRSMMQSKDNQKSNKIDLHELIGKVQLQRTLRRIKKQQLQEQIKFLESNVLVKGNFIYNPASSLLISTAEQKESLVRMQNSVDELQRVIKLSIPCATASNNLNKLALLNSQEARLNDCEKILEQQHTKLLKFTQFIEQKRNFSQKFSFGEPYVHQIEPQEEISNYYENLTINQHEVDTILQIDDIKPLVINLEHPFNSIESNITQLRTKVKKIEKSL